MSPDGPPVPSTRDLTEALLSSRHGSCSTLGFSLTWDRLHGLRLGRMVGTLALYQGWQMPLAQRTSSGSPERQVLFGRQPSLLTHPSSAALWPRLHSRHLPSTVHLLLTFRLGRQQFLTRRCPQFLTRRCPSAVFLSQKACPPEASLPLIRLPLLEWFLQWPTPVM